MPNGFWTRTHEMIGGRSDRDEGSAEHDRKMAYRHNCVCMLGRTGVRQRRSDAFDGEQLVRTDQPDELRLLERFEHSRARLISAHLERILSLQFEQQTNLREYVRDFVFGHASKSSKR